MTCASCLRRKQWIANKVRWIVHREKELLTTLYPNSYSVGDTLYQSKITRIVSDPDNVGVFIVYGRKQS